MHVASRTLHVPPVALLVFVSAATSLSAHRLDEYLQATRIALASNAVEVEIDLTPGAAVASKVLALVDTNGDGQLSPAERTAYAMLVVTSTALEIDHRRVALALASSEFPTADEMTSGTGTIRLTAHARVRAGSAGRHELRYFNIHEPEISTYLVNALVPPPGFEIRAQRRDRWQHELALDYGVEGTSAFTGWSFAAVFALLAVVRVLTFRASTTAARPASWWRRLSRQVVELQRRGHRTHVSDDAL